ncbi:uncharacterized protein isoform X1 [Musca autumnalis]|uniref:uncharacterized protein isoform X1 n=1 Tax=Musca autumnalis TaxID=221902 RepID=UPI003CEF5DB0
MSVLLLEHICITCLQESSVMHKLMDTREDEPTTSIQNMLQRIAPILIANNLDSSMPVEICGECLNKLTTAFDFQKMCLSSYEKLQGVKSKEIKMCDVVSTGDVEDLEMALSQVDYNETQENESDPVDISEMLAVKLETEINSYDEESQESGVQLKNDNSITKGDVKPKQPRKVNPGTLEERTCPQCGKIFVRKDSMKWHSRVHNEENKHVCDICQYRFSSPLTLKSHIVSKHQYGKLLTCTICGCSNGTFPALALHMKKKHPEVPPYKCEMCNEVFPSEGHREHHMKVHRGFCCDDCDAVFETKQSLHRHRSNTHNDGPFPCPQCGKIFTNRSALKQHLRTHSEPNFPCPECPSRFKEKSKLQRHMVIHTKVAAYVCDICGASFTWQDSLTLHQRRHQKIDMHFKCTVCDKSFRTKFKLQRHEKIHSGEKENVCSYCGRGFTQKGDLLKHLRLHLGEKIYSCDECPEAFKYKKELRDHKNQHYKEKHGLTVKREESQND